MQAPTPPPPDSVPAASSMLTRAPQPHGAGPLPSSTLLQGQKSVLIEHRGLIYRLQETKLGKLILTK
ncbi:MAG: hypothetical protein RLZ81_3186 [Pseudomonadota bacterium]